MATTLYATFDDISMAEKAAGALLDYGTLAEDISLVAGGHEKDTERRDYTAHSATLEERRVNRVTLTDDADTTRYASGIDDVETRRYTPSDTDMDTTYVDETEAVDLNAKSGITTTTPGDAASGAAKGAAIGLGVGALAALASIMIPGFGLVVGGGALATALAGAAGATAAGAVAGGMYGYLKDQGVPDEAIETYEEAWRAGGSVLAVSLPSGGVDEVKAREILAKYHARNVNAFGRAA